MKITDVRTTVVANRFNAEGKDYERFWSIVEVETDEGIVGLGRTSANHNDIIMRVLRPLLIGEDPLRIEWLWEKMYSLSHTTRWKDEPTDQAIRAYRQQHVVSNALITSIGAVDVALWDLTGKALNQPVYKLLGGYSDKVHVYADGSIYFFGVKEVAERAAHFIHEQGFGLTKVHLLGDDRESTIAKVKLARELVGPEAKLAVDVHRMWSPQEAIEITRILEEYDILWIEEPIHWDDQVRGMAILADAVKTTVAAGEGEWTLFACRDLVADGGIRILEPDTVNAGGFTQMRRIAAVAAAYHVPISPHGASYPEFNCHMIAALPNGYNISCWSALDPFQIWSQLYLEPVEIIQGTIYMNDKPGLGMELNKEWVAKHKVS